MAVFSLYFIGLCRCQCPSRQSQAIFATKTHINCKYCRANNVFLVLKFYAKFLHKQPYYE